MVRAWATLVARGVLALHANGLDPAFRIAGVIDDQDAARIGEFVDNVAA